MPDKKTTTSPDVAEPTSSDQAGVRTGSGKLPLPLGESRGEGAQHSDQVSATPVENAKSPVTKPPSKVDEASTSKSNGATQSTAPANVTTSNQPSSRLRSILKKAVPIVVLALAAVILFGIIFGWNGWVGGASIQKTDDAILRADITPLSTRVSGTVAQVAVSDYQKVKAGDLLVQLKDDDFKAQVAQAEAGVAAAQAALENNAKQKDLQSSRIVQAQAGIQAATAEIAQTGAAIEAARSDVENAQAGVQAAEAKVPDAQAGYEATKADVERTSLERKRQEALVELGSATKQKLEQVVADQERFAAILDSRKAEVAQAQALVGSRRAEVSKARAQVSLRQSEQQRARAQLSGRSAEVDAQIKQRAVLDAQQLQLQADLNAKQEQLKVAQTNLDYTRILAPTDGIVGERKVRIGQLVSPGTQVISLVENTVWVQANYKETQLTNVAKGDAAEITVDTFPGVTLKGHVEEIAPASGSQFALLPPDNATGNYTKIVQRIPVKIVLDPNPALAEKLRPGMSVIAQIRTGARNKG
jgi:membrane fusion protein, multidrug efflux system